MASGFTYYGYRYLDTQLGRWLSRDPIDEMGGLNLYALLENPPINIVDYLGLAETYPDASGEALDNRYKCSKSVCGPDVTKALDEAILKLGNLYRALSQASRLSVCASIYHSNGWDIEELYSKNTDGIPNLCGQRDAENEKHCADTVTYKGKCYYRGSLNYILWGKMHQLCGSGQNRMNDSIWAWKWVTGGSFWRLKPHHTYYPAYQWTQYGYRGGRSTSEGEPASDRPYCKPCKIIWPGPFHIHAGVDAEGKPFGVNPGGGRDDRERESKRVFPLGVTQ